jgi:predicted dehydrogenase
LYSIANPLSLKKPRNPMSSSSRRKFLRQLGGTAALFSAPGAQAIALDESKIQIIQPEKRHDSNSKIRIACIGLGLMGFGDTETALQVPGVEMAGACDLYEGHLERARATWGKDLYCTRDFRELLERKDIDAVIVATPDHWHDHISIAAMRKGKHVYCEKPMVQHWEEGHAVIKAQKETGKVFIVGSQGVSSVALAEAKKIIKSGALGEINLIEAVNDRMGALGAWQYSIPLDASPKTVDWDRFLGDAPKRPYDPERFFRWRSYRDYGTGVAGDLFVHLISAVHFAMDSNGPNRVFSSGQLALWKDGRDVPDVLTAIMDYPKTGSHGSFQMQLRVNFADGSGGSNRTRIFGSEGMLEWGGNRFTLKRQKLPGAPGYGGWDTYNVFTEEQKKAYQEWYNKKYTEEQRKMHAPEETRYAAPQGYDDRLDHFANFFEGIRSGKQIVEDASFGLRAAGPALLSNLSYFQQKVVKWDPVSMRVLS